MLILAGSSIGDVADISPRLIEALGEVDVIAAEDTRRFRALLKRLNIFTRAQVVSYFDGNESGRVSQLLDALKSHKTVLVISDAGMPTISDPGYRLVRAALDNDVAVTAIPGPSAVLTALAVSGLAVDRFCFEGFLPRKQGERSRRLQNLANEERTMVFFEAPHRLTDMLTDCAAAFGADRQVAVCRELTKTYEEVIRGEIGEVIQQTKAGVRGEITIVLAGAQPEHVDLDSAAEMVAQLQDLGHGTRSAVAQIAREVGISKNDLYATVLQARKLSVPKLSDGELNAPSQS